MILLVDVNFVNLNFDVVYLEVWIVVDDENVVILEVLEIKNCYYIV